MRIYQERTQSRTPIGVAVTDREMGAQATVKAGLPGARALDRTAGRIRTFRIPKGCRNERRIVSHQKRKHRIECTKVEVFVEKRVRRCAQTAGATSRRGATKKREISRTLFFHKLTLLELCKNATAKF